MIVPKGFLPSEDQGSADRHHRGRARVPSFDAMVAHQRQLAAIVQQDPNVDRLHVVGRRPAVASPTINQGRVFMQLKPLGRAQARAPTRSPRELDPKLASVPGMRVYLQNPPPISIGGTLEQEPVSVHAAERRHRRRCISDADEPLAAEAATLPGLTDVTSDLQIKNPQVHVAIDRDRAASLGVTATQIENALYNAYGSRAGLHDLHAEQPVLGRHGAAAAVPARPRRARPAVHPARAPATSCRSSALARFTPGIGPLTVNHSGQLPVGHALLQPRARRLARRRGDATCSKPAAQMLPVEHHHGVLGHRAGVPDAQRGLLGLLVLAILVIYIVLGILYESFIHPLTIFPGFPFAGFGALLTLLHLRHGSERLRLRRHHHAGRPREEERDHDDRLRDRGRAEGGQVGARRDPGSLPRCGSGRS